MESQGTPSSQKIFEKEEQSWRNHTSYFQNLLQSYRNQNSMILYKDRHSLMKCTYIKFIETESKMVIARGPTAGGRGDGRRTEVIV